MSMHVSDGVRYERAPVETVAWSAVPRRSPEANHASVDGVEMRCMTSTSSVPQQRASQNEVKRGNVVQTLLAATSLSFEYTAADVRRRPRNCFLGCIAVFIVVFFTGIVLAAISKTSYMLLRFSELTVGEMDAAIYASDGVVFVNYTNISQRLQQNASQVITGSAPRWLARGNFQQRQLLSGPNARTSNRSLSMNVLVGNTAIEKSIGIGRGWPYREIGYGETQATDSALAYLSLSANIGQRATFTLDVARLLSQQSLSIPSSISANSGTSATISPVSFAVLQLLLSGVANLTAVSVPNSTDVSVSGIQISTSQLMSPMIDMNVADAVSSPTGKYPTALGNTMLMDSKQFMQLVIDQSCIDGGTVVASTAVGITGNTAYSTIVAPLASLLSSVNLDEYALIVIAMFQGRFETYYKAYNSLVKDMIVNSNALMRAVDYRFQGQITYPLATLMISFSNFSAVLSSAFAAVVVVIIVLSAILVYSLLGMNSEERQYEMAMIRSQGMDKRQLLGIMITEVLVFTLPGVACGILLILAVNAVLERVLSDFAVTPYDPFRLPVGTTVFAGLLGLALPLASNYAPVMEAFQASLREALDVNRQRWSETQVTMVKLAELGLEMWQTLLGLFLVISGFAVYYLLPLSFIYQNVTFFFVVMNLILLTMLFGLCLMAYSFQGALQQMWLWLMLWGKDKRLRKLIEKNFEAHRSKNTRAFVMFMLCVACVTYGGVAFAMLADTLSALTELASGADLYISSSSFDYPLNRSDIDRYLATSSDFVAAWSYATYPVTAYPQITSSTSLRNILGSSTNLALIAVTPTFMNSIFSRYVSVASTAAGSYAKTYGGSDDVVLSLYTNPSASLHGSAKVVYSGYPDGIQRPDALAKVDNVIPIICASNVDPVLSINPNTIAVVRFTYRLATGLLQTTDFLAQPRALMDRLSGFAGVSSMRFAIGSGVLIVSMDNFMRLIQPNATDFANVTADSSSIVSSTALVDDAVLESRFQKLFIRLRPDLSADDRKFFVNSLQVYLDPYYSTSVDTKTIVDSVIQVANLIEAFYYFSAAVSVVLTSFMVWLVFVSNVTQNAWAFGVLRSLGFTKAHLLRATVYEALCIALSAFSLGLPIGVLVGFTASLQLNTFLNLPYAFNVPYPVLLVLLGVSLLAATVGSWIPLHRLNQFHIAAVLKKYN